MQAGNAKKIIISRVKTIVPFCFHSALLTGCNVQILFELLYDKHYSFCSFGEDRRFPNFRYLLLK